MRRVVTAVLTLVSTLAIGAAAVHAESYPPGGPSIATPSSAPHPGDSIVITLEGYCPNDEVNLSFDGPGGAVDLGKVTVDGSGVATFPWTAESSLGTYTFTGTGTDCPEYVASMSIVVAPNIPTMGTDSTKSGLLLGSGAVGAGVLLVGAAALRRRRPAAA